MYTDAYPFVLQIFTKPVAFCQQVLIYVFVRAAEDLVKSDVDYFKDNFLLLSAIYLLEFASC